MLTSKKVPTSHVSSMQRKSCPIALGYASRFCYLASEFCLFTCSTSLPRSRFLDVTQCSPKRVTRETIAPACKESRVRQPGASGFCDWASEFCA